MARGDFGRREAPNRGVTLISYLGLAVVALSGLYTGWHLRLPLAMMHGTRFHVALALVALSAVACVVLLGRSAVEIKLGRRTRTLARRGFVCLALGYLAFVFYAQPFQRLHLELSAAVWAGLTAIVLSAEEPKRGRGSALQGVEIAFACVLGLLLGAELSLRAYAWAAGRFFDAAPVRLTEEYAQAKRRLTEVRYAPGEGYWGFPLNAHGCYDEPFTARTPGGPGRVVCISDSHGFGMVHQAAHFTSVCELELGVEVLNLASPRSGPREYVYLLREEGLDLDPDVVCVVLYTGNDLDVARLARAYELPPLERAFDPDSLYLWRLYDSAARRRELRAALASGAPVSDQPIDQAAMGWVDDRAQEPPAFTQDGYMRLMVDRALRACSPDADWSGLFEALEALIETAGEVPLVVALLPDELQVEDAIWEEVVRRVPDAGLERDRPQRALREWLEPRGVGVIDLLPAMRAEPARASGDRELYHLRDTHLSTRGNAVVGRALAEGLEPYFE